MGNILLHITYIPDALYVQGRAGLKYTLSRAALNQIYISYVLPIWNILLLFGTVAQIIILTRSTIQHEAARIVTGLTRSVSIEKTVHGMWLDNADQQKSTTNMTFMYKVSNQLVPSYISDIMPP